LIEYCQNKKGFSLKNIRLNGNDIEQKRQEILSYFLDTYESFEKLFDIFSSDEVFYLQANNLRHKMIFYFGHTAAFYINKLILGKHIKKRINPSFESIFAIGVDEMQWDDINNIEFPSVDEVKKYRELVKQVVIDYIKNTNFTLPITWDNPMWVILMGCEHENIHFETSSVLHRQLDIKYIKQNSYFEPYNRWDRACKNELIDVIGATVELGKPHDNDDFYGWDNEYGKKSIRVGDFKASKYLVSNEEFLAFVNDKGYENDSFWDQEAKAWRDENNAKYPTFWIQKQDGSFAFRTLTKIIELPLNWPVEVNYHEAYAFCKYKSKLTNKNITLPSEAQYYRLREVCGLDDEVIIGANVDNQYSSSTPIDMFKQGDFYDVVGNVWQWSSSCINGYEGFKVHPLYDDFSVPTFDNKHALIKGASWASKGNEIVKHSRYAFRKHFFQHAGFRYIETSKNENEEDNYYESDEIISQYCEFHYGDEYLGVENFPKKIAQIAKEYASSDTKNVLDIGCSVGRTSFELKKYFPNVTGIDFSTRFIKVAIDLMKNKQISYLKKIEGDISSKKTISLEDNNLQNIDLDGLSFWQEDACNLKPTFNGYDLIIAVNLIDRLYDPYKFLEDIKQRLNSGGVFLIASPFTWSEEYVSKDMWLGGKIEEEKQIYSQDRLNEILLKDFDLLCEPFEVEFVIQEHCRKYQHTFSLCSIWKKR